MILFQIINIKLIIFIFPSPLKLLIPYITPPIPRLDNIIDIKSSLGFVRVDTLTK